MKHALAALLLAPLTTLHAAELKLAAVFSDHMVLQRGKPVPVWGWANAVEKVSVEFGGQTKTTVADASGKWFVKLDAMPASAQGRALKVNRLALTDVLVGDVWLCSGQSNMGSPVGAVRNAAEEVAKASHPAIRLFKVRNRGALAPLPDVEGRWAVCTPDAVKQIEPGVGFSAVAYFFGRDLHVATGVPVGLIQSAWGGTSAEQWISLEGFKSDPQLRSYPELHKRRVQTLPEMLAAFEKQKAEHEKQQKLFDQHQPGVLAPKPLPRWAPGEDGNAPSALYDGMIVPLVPLAIAGVVWWQGENHTARPERAAEYELLFRTLITDWRKQWQQDLPFYFCQLANYKEKSATPTESHIAVVREAQRAALALPNTGMAVLIDLGESDDIHIRNKQDVGARLSRIALAKSLGKTDLRWSGPIYRSMKVEGDTIRLTFDPAGGELVAQELPATYWVNAARNETRPLLRNRPGSALEGFAICGDDRKWVWADAKIDGQTVLVSAPEMPHPVAVRYAWADNPTCNLYNKEGLPASPFQTDAIQPAIATPAPAPAPSAIVAPPLPPSLTPPAPLTPRINGASVFGVRPGSPVLYSIAASGERPMTFVIEGLPAGLNLDAATGYITGSVANEGTHELTVIARNRLGEARRTLRLVVGETIALTPPMGWSSWNCWASAVTQEKVLRAAKAMVTTGLQQHGWTYINIDDSWQGARGGPHNAIQPNAKFPDIKALADEIHGLGLKFGIYSTPWRGSYAGFVGSSCDRADGIYHWIANGNNDENMRLTSPDPKQLGIVRRANWKYGATSFATQDAKQWADWGVDFLKYDWWPIDVPHTDAMRQALRASGRDIVFSLSNGAPFKDAAEWGRLANMWRTTGDMIDTWLSMSRGAFVQDKWAPFQSPGHYNDADMLVVGMLGWGRPRPNRLTADEQYLHMSLWCLFSAPLVLGCDLEQLDPFTLGLLTNDEVLEIDQDPLVKQATRITPEGDTKIYVKQLADGGKAVGLVNAGAEAASVTLRWDEAGLKGPQRLRDLWRQKDLGTFEGTFSAEIPTHGVLLLKLMPQ